MIKARRSLLALVFFSITIFSANAFAAPYAYIANWGSANVSVLDTATNTVVATIPVGTAPAGVAVNLLGTRVYVTNDYDNTVSVIDTSTNAVVATIPVGTEPYGVAVNPAGTRVYVANNNSWGSGTVSVIDTSSNTVVATIPVGTGPYGVAVNPAGTRVYVTNISSSNVSVIDTSSNTVVATIPVGSYPRGIAVNPAGTRVYVANTVNGNVSVIDTSTNTVAATISVGSSSEGVAVNPAGTKVYVTHGGYNGYVLVIDTSTNITADIPAGPYPVGIAVNPAGTRIYVTYTYGYQPDFTVIDTSTNTIVATVPAGSWPSGFGQFITPFYFCITDPANYSYLSGTSYPIKGVAQGAGTVTKVEVSTNGGSSWATASDTSGNGSWSSWQYSWTLPAAKGIYTLVPRATNSSYGVVSGTPIMVKVGDISPNSYYNGPALFRGTSATLTGTAIDWSKTGIKQVQVSTDGGSTWATAMGASATGGLMKWSYTWSLPSDGKYTIQTRATDKAGHVETPGAGTSVMVDNTPPTSTITAPSTNATLTGATYKITGTASDGTGSGVKTVYVSTDGGNTWNAATGATSWSYTWNLPVNGKYTIRSYAADNAGNQESPGIGNTVTVSNTLPSTTIIAPKQGATVGGFTYTITGTAKAGSLPLARVDVSTDGGATWHAATGTTSWAYSWTLPYSGSFTIKSRAVDSAGNMETPGAGTKVTLANPTVSLGTAYGPACGTVVVPIILTNPASAPVSAISVGISFPSALFAPSVTVGPSGSSGKKNVSYYQDSSNHVQITVSGLNQNTIGAGTLADVVFKTVAASTYTLNMAATLGTPDGKPLPASSGTSSVILSVEGDCDNNGTVTAAEVQNVIDENLKKNPVTDCADTNRDGVVAVNEVQLAIDMSILYCPSSQSSTAYSVTIGGVAGAAGVNAPKAALNIGSATVSAGGQVKIPVRLAHIKGRHITAASTTVHYNPKLFDTPTVFYGRAAALAGKNVAYNAPSPGELIITAEGSGIQEMDNGTVAYIILKAKNGISHCRTVLRNSPSITNGNGELQEVTGSNGIVTIR